VKSFLPKIFVGFLTLKKTVLTPFKTWTSNKKSEKWPQCGSIQVYLGTVHGGRKLYYIRLILYMYLVLYITILPPPVHNTTTTQPQQHNTTQHNKKSIVLFRGLKRRIVLKPLPNAKTKP
jgi:hypothetical protein